MEMVVSVIGGGSISALASCRPRLNNEAQQDHRSVDCLLSHSFSLLTSR
jgi:hypothetical protein